MQSSTVRGTIVEEDVRHAQSQAAIRRHGVDGTHHFGVSRLRILMVTLLTVLAMCLSAFSTVPHAFADEATDSPSTSESAPASPTESASAEASTAASDNIVDTENVLGSNLSKVSDAIAQTKITTGVNVRLLFLQSFNTSEQPSEWATNLLNSLDPAPNTVLLAVASNDGNLVVVVSSNSDEWLRNSKTVNKLSDAALAPIVDHDDADSPNWAQSAIDMMKAIETAKATSTSHTTISVGVIVLLIVLVLLVALVIFMIVWRRKHTKKVGRHSERRTA